MKAVNYWHAVIFAFISLLLVESIAAGRKNVSTSSKTSVEGLVRDIACPIQNKEATATNFNLQCAMECAKQGSPLIILSKQGVIYIPISNQMPDKSQRQQLMPFLGKWVKITGHIYVRGGTHAIAIETIQAMKGVHLNSNAQ